MQTFDPTASCGAKRCQDYGCFGYCTEHNAQRENNNMKRPANSVGFTYVHQGLSPFGIAAYFNSEKVGTIKRLNVATKAHEFESSKPAFTYFFVPKDHRGPDTSKFPRHASVDSVKREIEG